VSRPLLITDCDEVLLHMVVPFAQWVDHAHGIHFDLSRGEFTEALRHKETGDLIEREAVWPLLEDFFLTQMHRQQAIAGAVAAMREIGKVADIVVLTNIGPDFRARRVAQLLAAGIDAPVVGNHGGKGAPLAMILAERKPSVAVFVDDLDVHHDSVARHAPDVWRLHMVGEPVLAGHIKPAPMAHARIDDWVRATAWILDRFAEGRPRLDHHRPEHPGPEHPGLDPAASAVLNRAS